MPMSPTLVNPATDWKSFTQQSAWFRCCLR